MSDENPNTPEWLPSVVAVVRWQPDWLLATLESLASTAGQVGQPLADTTPARVLALREIVAAITPPWEGRNAESYAVQVLALLETPRAALFGEDELEAIITEVIALARAECDDLSAMFALLGSDEEEEE